MNKKQPTFNRQKLLLALLHAFGGKLSKLDLQKLLFLYIEENTTKKRAYEFIPYHFGCYSFQANADLRTMHNYAFININNKTNMIEEKTEYNPLDLIKENERKNIIYFAKKYKDLHGDKLISYVYNNYPYYTLNSKIAHIFLNKKYQKQPKLFEENNLFFTIGYEGISFENYINKLIDNDIKVLFDVRKNPISMKFGFSKNMLKHTLEKIGIKYIHLPELGIASENRQLLNTLDDYKVLFKEYESTTIQTYEAQNALKSIYDTAQQTKVVLTCFEKDIEYCHRGVIARTLHNKYGISYNNIS